MTKNRNFTKFTKNRLRN